MNAIWYVYVVKFNDIWLVKVWKSITPLSRILNILSENNPTKLWYMFKECDESLYKKVDIEILRIYKTENHTILEKEIHNLLSNYKWDYKREYFKIDDELLFPIIDNLWLEEDFLEYKWKHNFYLFEITSSFDDIYRRRKLLREIT